MSTMRSKAAMLGLALAAMGSAVVDGPAAGKRNATRVFNCNLSSKDWEKRKKRLRMYRDSRKHSKGKK